MDGYHLPMLTFFGIALGIALLIGGGTLLVRGAAELAASFGISPMVVGLTIVGFGTSSPELVVNLIGAFQGATGLAFGNVVGSNISNLALVLGAAAIMSPIAIRGEVVRRELPLLLLATTLMAVLALDGPLEGLPAAIGRTDSIVLMLIFCVFIYISALDLMRMRRKDALLVDIRESPIVTTPSKGRFSWLLVIGGFLLLFFGGEMTVRNAVAFAEQVGVSTTIVGLFVVAVGTSMPELVTSIIAAVRRESDLALGNVIGSNIFNSLMVLPASGVVAQIPVPRGGIGDLALSWILTAALIPVFFFGKANLGRVTGAILLVVYIGYAAVRIASA
jgi:cation:H+ antiporter